MKKKETTLLLPSTTFHTSPSDRNSFTTTLYYNQAEFLTNIMSWHHIVLYYSFTVSMKYLPAAGNRHLPCSVFRISAPGFSQTPPLLIYNSLLFHKWYYLHIFPRHSSRRFYWVSRTGSVFQNIHWFSGTRRTYTWPPAVNDPLNRNSFHC